MSIDPMSVILSIYQFLPAYFANATPTILGGGRPIDLGRSFFDGRPIFGPNKTFRGFISGLLAGTTVGIIQKLPLFGFFLSLGALLGDLTGSFIKRRFNISSGEPFPILDQLDFVVGAFLLSSFNNSPNAEIIFFVVFFTPFIHILTNFFAYLFKLKKKPW